ncbi:MAG TPA: M56 family metallopeptidase [Gemmatimonadaceae bacterium]|nr:M56 family metallopeptidase [Gemmatimonadaceae bacterium]
MIASWMSYAALIGALVAIAALAIDRVADARGWPRRIVWFGAVLATLAWPLADVVRRLLPKPAAPATLMPFTVTVQPMRIVADQSLRATVTAFVDRGLLVAWIVLSAVLLARLLSGMVALRRSRRDWPSRDVDGARVRVSGNVGPAVIGLQSMDVVLPEWTLALDKPLRAMVLEHEQEHRRARDPQLLFIGALAAALMPWNVALWYCVRRLRLAIELDCDARVLRVHPAPERYGLLMLTIAQRRGLAPTLFAPMLSEPTSQLERRIVAMQHSTRRLVRATMIGGVCVAAGALALACSLQTENPTAPGPKASPTKTAPNQTYFEFQVEHTARPVPGSTAPRYPDLLRESRIEGEVLAQFVVNPDSTVDMRTFRVLRSTHDLFTAAVRQSITTMKFVPALVGGRPVRQLVQMPFQFALSRTALGTPVQPDTKAAAAQRAPAAVRMQREGIAPTRVVDGQTYFEFQVEQPVAPLANNPPAKYPDMLRAAKVGGEVLAQFTVDTLGYADMSTFKVLKSSHELFTQSVKNALPNMRFSPARVGGKKVKQLVQMPFMFALTKD